MREKEEDTSEKKESERMKLDRRRFIGSEFNKD